MLSLKCFTIKYLTLKYILEELTWGERHKQTLILFFGMVIAYGLRVNLSVAIVAMTDKSSANTHFIVSMIYNNTQATSSLGNGTELILI